MLILVFLAGLLLGLLLNLIIIRLPRERNLFSWPHCTRTGEQLAVWQLLPVLGWLLQRGRARDGRPLHWVYPLVELLTASVLTLLYAYHGFSPTFFYMTLVAVVLIITGAIDWLHRWIYTVVVLGSTLLVLLAGLAVPDIALLDAVMGALVGGVVFFLFYMLARLIFPAHGVPFGLGDVYLAMFIGAAVGLTRLGPTLIYGIFLAGIVSAVIVIAKRVFGRRDVPEYISYGTYLCLGTLVSLFVQGL
jgi:leader peptidase (prepilin peptidase)/N-methyltransferase